MIELAVAVGGIAASLYAALRRLKPCRHRDMLRMRQCMAHHDLPDDRTDWTGHDPRHVMTNDEQLARYEPDMVG